MPQLTVEESGVGHSLPMRFMPASRDVGNGPQADVLWAQGLHRAITSADLTLIENFALHHANTGRERANTFLLHDPISLCSFDFAPVSCTIWSVC